MNLLYIKYHQSIVYFKKKLLHEFNKQKKDKNKQIKKIQTKIE